MKFNKIVYSLATLSLLSNTGFAQQQSENLPPNATLQQLIDYALRNQISVKQAQLDEAIGEKDIDISLSGWYPQLGLKGSYNYNVIVPVVNIGGNNIKMGQNNASALTLQADQQLLNPELIQAKRLPH
ncbi:TolC family protein [Sphingobacterium sp. E70]|uniref:TolC family protein n=1 Tax=Sphingobacterium sp. E70 TaxID=2853439 RepID=UPI00211CF4EF|nr:TolC family protein [Sphingobacterium sp. E70]